MADVGGRAYVCIRASYEWREKKGEREGERRSGFVLMMAGRARAHEIWLLWWPTDKAHGRHTLAWLPTPGARLVNELGWGWGLALARRRGRVQLVGGLWVNV